MSALITAGGLASSRCSVNVYGIDALNGVGEDVEMTWELGM